MGNQPALLPSYVYQNILAIANLKQTGPFLTSSGARFKRLSPVCSILKSSSLKTRMYLLCAVCGQTREYCRNTKVHTRHKFVKIQYVFLAKKCRSRAIVGQQNEKRSMLKRDLMCERSSIDDRCCCCRDASKQVETTTMQEEVSSDKKIVQKTS